VQLLAAFSSKFTDETDRVSSYAEMLKRIRTWNALSSSAECSVKPLADESRSVELLESTTSGAIVVVVGAVALILYSLTIAAMD
jgi:hypothetical protein